MRIISNAYRSRNPLSTKRRNPICGAVAPAITLCFKGVGGVCAAVGFSLWYAALMTNRFALAYLTKECTRIMTTKPSLKLTHEGALKALSGAIAKAEEIGVPQNITIVDDGGNLLAFVRMD